MEEKQALKKFCPHMPRRITKIGKDNLPGYCVGSQCMMWEPELECERDEIIIPPNSQRDDAYSLIPEGWYPIGTKISDWLLKSGGKLASLRTYEKDSGSCGLISKEGVCNYG